jgi:hypothetical protein
MSLIVRGRSRVLGIVHGIGQSLFDTSGGALLDAGGQLRTGGVGAGGWRAGFATRRVVDGVGDLVFDLGREGLGEFVGHVAVALTVIGFVGVAGAVHVLRELVFYCLGCLFLDFGGDCREIVVSLCVGVGLCWVEWVTFRAVDRVDGVGLVGGLRHDCFVGY